MKGAALAISYLWLFLLILYTTSPLPESGDDPVGNSLRILQDITAYSDQIINLGMFILPAFLMLPYIYVNRKLGDLTLAVATVTALNSLVSLYAETIQIFVPSRVASLQDILLNTTGALIGATLSAIFVRMRSSGTQNK